MSRKKKKKLKQLEQRQQPDDLQGWNCPAVEIDEELGEELTEDDSLHPIATPVIEIVADPIIEPITPDMVAVEPQLPEPVTEAAIEPTVEAVIEPAIEAAVEPIAVAVAEAAAEPAVAKDKQLADYMHSMSRRMSDFINAPRRSEREIAEDNEKFGGLDDDSAALAATEPDDEPESKTIVIKNTLATSRRRVEKTAKTVVYSTGSRSKDLAAALLVHLHELADWAFQECYYIGVLLIRYCSDMRRLGFRAWTWWRYTVPPFISTKRKQLWRMFDGIADSSLEPFRDITVKTRSMKYQISSKKSGDEMGQPTSVTRIIAHYIYSLGRPINRIANFLLPILGCAVFAATVLYFQQVSYALEVEYDGVKLGYVERESDFYEAQKLMYERMMGEEYGTPEDNRPSFRLGIVNDHEVMDIDSLTNKIMSMSKHEVVTADGVFIDGAFLGAVEDGSEFLLYIDGILSGYRTGLEYERVQFVKKVTVQKGIYPQTSLRPIHEIRNALESNETLPQTHKVAEEETLETIAESNNTTVDAIMKLNTKLLQRAEDSRVEVPSLLVGEELLVDRIELSLGIQVTRRETYSEDIAFGVDYTDMDDMLDSYVVTVSNGSKGEMEIVSDFTYVDGAKINEAVVSKTVVKEPVNAKKKRGTQKPTQFIATATGGKSSSFMWPVNGGYVSAGLYSYRGHTGMDIAAPYGTGVYASADGTVTYAVNYSNGSYGKRVDILHGNGLMTRYAHNSEVLVKSGQVVKQGQLIARIGRTGNASGNHCHFEVRLNGVYMDPANFVGSRFPGYK